MDFPVTPTPTLEGFTAWVYGFGGVPQQFIDSSNSIWLTYAYNTAVSIVHPWVRCVPGPIYLQMVYNLGMDRLVNWCPDVVPPVAYKTDKDGQPIGYFAFLRQQFKVNAFVAGVIQSAGDEGTQESLLVPDQFKNITLGQLQNLSTPWGRYYIGETQSVGTNWGLS